MSFIVDIFKTKPVLDEDSIVWLFDTFKWVNDNLDADIFFNKTELILPSNQFFDGHSDNAADMAQLIFNKVQEYANLQHWPCRLFPLNGSQLEKPQLPYLDGDLRGKKVINHALNKEQYFSIFYNSAQVKNPEAMIAYFAQTLAYYLILLSPNKPNAVEGNIGPLSEVVAVFMGFGVMLSNSAFNYKNVTCGSCQSPSTERESYLSQYDVSYALAIFCVLKGVDKQQVLGSLKSNLKSFFKKAYKEVQKRDEVLKYSL